MVGQACKMRTNLNRFASLVIIVWWCVLFISHTMSKSLMKSLFQFHVHFREITSDLGRVHITFVRYCLICDTLLHLFIWLCLVGMVVDVPDAYSTRWLQNLHYYAGNREVAMHYKGNVTPEYCNIQVDNVCNCKAFTQGRGLLREGLEEERKQMSWDCFIDKRRE